MIRAFSKSEKKLEDIIKNVNDLFLKDTSNTITFVTAFIGVYDLNKNSFTYTNAGHLPAIYIKNKKLSTLQTKTSRAFGIDKIVDVTTNTIKLNKDDLIFIYSDGIIDAKNDKDEIFSNKKLEEFLINYDIDKSNNLLKDLFSKLNVFVDKSEIIDDMTAILIKKL
jgi:serine phosphatase RsbU (regulator of sigma subunit)